MVQNIVQGGGSPSGALNPKDKAYQVRQLAGWRQAGWVLSQGLTLGAPSRALP